MAAAEVVTRARNLAQQVTSRTVIRERLEAYNRGEVTLDGLAAFTRDKLADALDLSPEMMGIARFGPGGELVVAVGARFEPAAAPRPGGRAMVMSLSEIAGKPALLVAAPIIGKGGVVAGTDVVLVDAGSLKAIVDDARAMGRTSEAALIDASAAPLPASRWVLLLRMRATEATADVDRLLLWVMLGAGALIAAGVYGLQRMLNPLTAVLWSPAPARAPPSASACRWPSTPRRSEPGR